MVRGWLARHTRSAARVHVGLRALALAASAQVRPAARDTAVHARKPARLLIRRAMVIYGNGKPPYGPMDILVQDGVIANIAPTLPVEADAVIDATGKYVMPGLVDTHMHWHDERAGMPMPIQYERNLYLANGVTLTRENGGNFAKSKQWQAESAADQIIAPRMQVYWVVARGNGTAEAIRANIREAKARGADGLKIFGMDRDQLEATMAEAKAQGLKTTTHIAVEEVTARDFAELGVDSIEHFYGIADAALDGVQHFPAEMNYSNELLRFSKAGELYAQADPGQARQGARPDGGQEGRVEPDALDLRGQPRRHQGAEPALVQGVPAPGAAGLLRAQPRQSRLVLHRLDQHDGGALEAAVPHLDGCPALVRQQGRRDHDRRRLPASSIRCMGSGWCASWNCTRKPASTRST